MQVKKFEAPTLQEALDHVKRELGPEAIILQTRTHKGGFGLLSKASVEVTAAISERSIAKKGFFEKRVPQVYKDSVQKLSADKQVQAYEDTLEKHLARSANATRDQVALGSKKMTATRYIDIPDASQSKGQPKAAQAASLYTPEAATLAVQQSQTPKVSPVEEEVKYLKRMIEEIKMSQDKPASTDPGIFVTQPLQEAYELLMMNGVEKKNAYALIKQVLFEIGPEQAKNPEKVLDALCEEIISATDVHPFFADIQAAHQSGIKNDPVIVALVGPTGVGKTTTLAKVASQAVYHKKLKVALINLDCFKVGAADQLETYAKVMNLPFRSASNTTDLEAAINDFKGMDLILIDTTGRSHRDTEALRQTQTILNSVQGIHSQLVLSITTRDSEMNDMVNRFSLFNPKGLIFTKLDEATLYGALYNVHRRFKLPLLYFTTGQRVPEDIEEASKERVVALVMDL